MNIIRKKLIYFITRNLLKVISQDDFLAVSPKDKAVYFRGKKLDVAQRSTLVQSANDLMNNQLWQLIVLDMGFSLNEYIFSKASTTDEIATYRIGIWVLEQITLKIKRIASLQ